MKVCVIIPTYNESRAIAGLIAGIRQQVLDAVVVDDGSGDGTSRIAGVHGAVVLRNLRNEGKGASLAKGFRWALKHGYEAVITMDGDGQHLAEDIPAFLELNRHTTAGIIIGNRMIKTGRMPWLRVWTNNFMSWLISQVAKQEIPDSQ